MSTKRKPKEKSLTTFDELMSKAEAKYKELKMAKYPYSAPETLPGMQSDQVKALAFAIGSLLDSRKK